MRAATLESVPASPAAAEADVPRPEAGELLVKVVWASVNGFDVATAADYLQGMMEHRFPRSSGWRPSRSWARVPWPSTSPCRRTTAWPTSRTD